MNTNESPIPSHYKICELCGAAYNPINKKRDKERRFCSRKCGSSVSCGNRDKIPPESELRDLYELQRLSVSEIGERYSVHKGTVGSWLKRYGVPVHRGHHTLEFRGISPPSADELHRMILVDRIGYRAVARRYGVCEYTVSSWIQKHNIRRPTPEETRMGGIPELPSKEEAESLYESGNTLKSIAELYGVEKCMISRLFEKYGIEKRPDGFGGTRYACDDGTVVRSRYEMRVANWLLARSVPFEYEPRLSFHRQWRADFYANGWYIEIWGVVGSNRYDERKKRKIRGYHDYGCHLIELLPMHFSVRTHIMEARLGRTLSPPSGDFRLKWHEGVPAPELTDGSRPCVQGMLFALDV